ncbi:MAG: DUF3617 family protein [Erythrobacter sp.]|nr:MAG: DUF3617 family protein [Erythrobacter sp.]
MRPATLRPLLVLPLLAVLALSACSDEADEALTDEALSADEVAAVIDDNGAMPQPGEYSTQVSLIEFDAPGLQDATIAEARAEFEAGAAQPHLYCIGEDVTREAWLSEMVEAECTLSRFTANGNEMSGAMACTAEEGLNGRVEMEGRTAEQGANLTMTYTLPTAAGEGTVRMNVVSDRIGDCATAS